VKAKLVQSLASQRSHDAIEVGRAMSSKGVALMGAVQRIAEMTNMVLRTFRLIISAGRRSGKSACVFLLPLLVAIVMAHPAAANRFVSPERAYEAGLDAYRSGAFDQAIPALEEAAKAGIVEARFFLARIRGDVSLPYHDRAKAYRLYLAIVDEYVNIDRTDAGAPFVSKSLIALANYLRRGVPAAGIAANVPRALQYLDHAAKYFGDPDAQFEIAKLYLSGEDLPKDTEFALHWLSTLTRGGHPGAQALLADLFWQGELVKRDRVRALGLSILAMEQAPETDHFWIADTYQNIYCGSDAEMRQKGEAFANFWRGRFGRLGEAARDRTSLSVGHRLSAIRTCGNGDPVPTRTRPIDPPPPVSVTTPTGAPPLPPAVTPSPNGGADGRTSTFTLREAGASRP
jgi:TPR repeat protein